jgi:hypothetical protein
MAYLAMHERQPSTTLETVDAYRDVIAVLKGALLKLMSYYPPSHFADEGAEQYVSAVVADRTHWHYLRTSSNGVGHSGSIVQVLTCIGVVRDLERMIEETVSTLTWIEVRAHREEHELAWHRAWQEEVRQPG